MILPLLFGLFITLAVFALVRALRYLISTGVVETRLEQYAPDSTLLPSLSRFGERRFSRLDPVSGWGVGIRLADELAAAGIARTATEWSLLMAGVGVTALFLGTLRLNLLFGIILAGCAASLPLFYLRRRKRQRQQALIAQLPDLLTMLVGALRGGHSIAQALHIVADHLPSPASVEFGRVVRAMELGVSLQEALQEMNQRMQVDDLDLIVTAITVQYELGGNMAQSLEIISHTVRERIRLLREVRVLTSHQRFTAYVLALIPIGVALILFLVSPTYMLQLFAPGWVRLLPALALLLVGTGFLVLSKLTDIKV